jgi:hypothetical protein
MFMLQERRALTLLLIIAFVLAATSLFLESVGKRAFATRYSNDTPDGTLVILDGTIDRITSTTSGGNQIIQVSGVRIFIPSTVASSLKISRGDRVSLCGKVQTYHQEREILIQSSGDFIRERSGNP